MGSTPNKFPRTPHIFDLGSTTRDDLHLDSELVKKMLSNKVTIEEKVDGANLGISLDEYNLFVCQNRGKYVNSSTQNQFRYLDAFLENHRADLYEILSSDDKPILFGEWVYAKHGIYYDKLPSYFIAFDIYSQTEGKFYSREKFYSVLEETAIQKVSKIFTGTIQSKERLVELLNTTRSYYYDGPIEGLYIRLDEGDYLLHRSKLVSPQFQQEIIDDGHWSRRILVKNKVIY